MRAILTALLLVALAAPAMAQQALSRHWIVAFTAPDAQDRATATVVGAPENGAMALTIHDASGRLVYVDAWPMAWFHSNIPGPEGRYTVEQAFDAVAPQPGGDAGELRSSADVIAEPEAGGGAEWLETDPNSYDRAREKGGAMLCYAIGHESGRCAWFNAELGEGVALYGSGV